MEVLPAEDYEIFFEEALLQGVYFLGYRKTPSHQIVAGTGRTEMREISGNDLEAALRRDRAADDDRQNRNAAITPQEDLK
ncbi:hypothetical protein SAMN05444272_4436 [Roseibium suaedae]|uniref:Uncharacterized protein n=1 Tax=Roseibium suaedae TaxID=735517 RepID=A0A1M7PI86_9HYPH|nr:hypothetical protein SAMN05444272_4436 [Roseibium suaedae]